MEWIEPIDVKSAVKFSSSLVNSSEGDSQTIIHGSITDSNMVWFACGDRLDVVSTSHSGVQSRHFQCSQGQEFEVTCVAAVPNEPLSLVGLSSSTGSGAVALYNHVTSLILNSWSISHKVTCVCSMEIPNASYKQFLKSDCFLFALGTEEGHIMLLAIDQHFKFSAGTHQLDLNIVHYVTTDDILHKRVFFKPPVVLVIPLNDPMYRAGRFVLESMHESQAVLSIRQEEVSATVVRYIPQNQTLCVGYNTQGAFQLFSLKTLDLDFSGFAQGCNGEQLDEVLDFAFLEPEDDPRHFCYLTVVGQKSDEPRAAPYALLYSLTYVHKDVVPEGGILYEDLQYITLRLDLNFGPLILAAESDRASGDIKLLTCKSLPSSLAASTNNNSTRATTCNGLCYFAMSWRNAVYLAVFDLNQWYQAQMPSRWVFDDMSALCPFMGFYHTETGGTSARQVWIQPETLSIFHKSSTTPNEAFFYPSALSFRVVIVCPTEATVVLFLGIQSLILQRLSQAGSQVLNHPHRFYVQAMRAGLTPTEIVAPHTGQMAEALLNIGLENNSRSFLISCIRDEGANLNFVEKWAWQQVVNLKSLRENLCHILFDHSTQEMEPQMHNQLYHVTHQFNNLAVLYDVMDKRIRALNSGVNDKLRDKSRAINLLSLHLETVLWFLHGGLLPESDEGEEEHSSLPYPRRQLEQFYRNRKTEIENLSSSVKADEVLLIEQLVPPSVVALWTEERDCNTITYPPPSLYALLSAYLRPDVDDVTKHRLVQYVFMDLTWIYGRHPHYGNILQHLVTFPSTYSLKPSMIKVTQAFWHLDHQNFDDALSMLLDPLVHTMDITNAQQRAILRSFLYQDKRRHALKYATLRQPVCPELEDIQLHLTILIANSLISDALGYIRRNKNQRNSTELMQHLLNGCQEMRKISVLLTLPLTDDEEDHVTSFLKQSRNIDLQEALLLFYIQRCKYPDAIAYSQRLNQMWPPRDAISRERFNRRDMLMQTLIGALPPITCKLAAIANSRPTSTGGGKFPRPLSVSVLPATSKVQSSGSNFFRTVIEQSRATWMIEQKLHQEVQTPLKTRKRKLDTPDDIDVETEATPFLCNIVQPAQRNITLGMSLCFPSPKCNNTSSMEITQLDVDVTQPKQGKRPRFSLFPKSVAVKTDAEVVSVLQTPPIRRSRPLTTEAESSCSRPSSILKDKMRRFMNFSGFDGGQHPASDVDPSESEAEMEISVVDTSVKQLRFNLPQVTSPPTSESEIVEVAQDEDDNMDVDETHKLQQSNVAEDSQFLSFEEENFEALITQAAVEVEEAVPEEKENPVVVAVQETRVESVEEVEIVQAHVKIVETEAVDIQKETSNDGMELTNLEATSIQSVSHFASEVDGASNVVLTTMEPATVPQETAKASLDYESDESDDIVCLDSSSEECEEGKSDYDEEVDKEEEEQEEQDDEECYAEDDNQEGEEEEGEEEEEEQVHLKEDDEGEVEDGIHEVSQDEEQEVEDVDDEDEGNPEEEAEGWPAHQAGPTDGADRLDTESDQLLQGHSGDGSEFTEEENKNKQVSLLQQDQEADHESNQEQEFVKDVAESASDVCLATRTVVDYQEESRESLKEEISGDSHRMENVEPEDVNEPSRDDSEESDTDSSSQEDRKFSATTYSTTSTSYKKRFTITSSEEEYSSTEERFATVSATTSRLPPISGYSAVEPDLDYVEEPVSDPEEESVRLIEVEEEDQVSPTIQDEQPTGYSQIESDLEEMEMENEGEGGEEAEEESQIRPCEQTMASLVQSPDSPADVLPEESNNSATMVSDEEDQEEFELKLTETPTSTVVRRSERRRFSISSSEEDDDKEAEIEAQESEEPQEPKEQKQVVEPESSPAYDRSESPESPIQLGTSQQQQKMETQKSSVFIKTRLQLSDSEEVSSDEDVEPEVESDVEPEVESKTEQVEPDVDKKPVETLAGEEEEPENEAEPEKSCDEASVHSSGSTTDENEDLRHILQQHETVQIPLIPDACFIPTDIDLSTIVEEKSFDRSTPVSTAITSKSDLDTVEEEDQERVEEEEEEDQDQDQDQDQGRVEEEEEEDREEGNIEGKTSEEAKPEPEEESEQEPVVETKTPDEPKAAESDVANQIIEDISNSNASESVVNVLEAGIIEEPNFEALQPLSSEDDNEEIAQAQLTKKERRRAKSTKLSQVPLPFTSRRSVWEGERDRSPDSVTSEPPQTFEEMVGINTKTRRRRHSTSLAPATLQVTTRRSARLSTSINEAPDTSVVFEALAPPHTPPKSTSRRRSAIKGQVDADESIGSVPPSVEVSPADSSYSGRSSAPGTPMRRSARIALREQTPEPTASTDALIASLGRIRRHSSGPADMASPLRRSGRKSTNASRDNSPDSVTSEPAPRTDLTPSMRKPARTLRAAHKSATLNLFPVEEESELISDLARTSYRDRDLSMNRDSDESVSHDDEGPVPEGGKKQRKPRSRPSSVSSSPGGSGRYNLRRAVRPTELDIISEEAGAATTAKPAADATQKRIREDHSEESSDQAGQVVDEENEEATTSKRVVRNKRRKKTSEEAATTTEDFRFAPVPRPPPKSLPKREPVIKPKRATVRRSMRLDK